MSNRIDLDKFRLTEPGDTVLLASGVVFKAVAVDFERRPPAVYDGVRWYTASKIMDVIPRHSA